MRQLRYKIVLVLFIVLGPIYAQKQKVYNKTLVINNKKETKVFLNVDNLSIVVEESTDNKLHVACELEYINYTEIERNEFLKGIQIEMKPNKNNVFIKASSDNSIGDITYKIVDNLIIKGIDTGGDKKQDNKNHKTKEELIREINKENGKTLADLNKTFGFEDQKGNKVELGNKNVKILKSNFIFKIPAHVKLNINGHDSKVYLKNKLTNVVTIDVEGGTLKATELKNSNNKVKVNNATFKIGVIDGGEYEIKNISKVAIGSVKKAKIESELSKIEFGEIKNDVLINDFNSEFWFYNFSNQFNQFELSADYSKVHFFYPKTDYSLKVYGYNTINYIGDTTLEMNPSKKEKIHLMMERKKLGEGQFSGHMQFNMINSIIHSYSDTKLTINKP